MFPVASQNGRIPRQLVSAVALRSTVRPPGEVLYRAPTGLPRPYEGRPEDGARPSLANVEQPVASRNKEQGND
jgi:hypothetical protein